MFPIGDTDVRGGGIGILTIVLIVINVLAFLFELSLGQAGLESFFQEFGVVPAEILQGEELHSLLTSMFLHGGWLHLIGNMLFLWVFGDNVEVVLGKATYLGFYLLGGLAASAAHIIVNAVSTVPSIGASGAVAAILGAYVVMFPQSQVRVLLLFFFARVARTTAIVFIGIWAIMQFFNGIASLGVETAQTGGVAFWAHIGGFLFGVLIGLLLRSRARRFDVASSRG